MNFFYLVPSASTRRDLIEDVFHRHHLETISQIAHRQYRKTKKIKEEEKGKKVTRGECLSINCCRRRIYEQLRDKTEGDENKILSIIIVE